MKSLIRLDRLTISGIFFLLLIHANLSYAGDTDTGSLFDGSEGNRPGTIDTDINISLPDPPPDVEGSAVEGSSSTYTSGSSTGTTGGYEVSPSSGTESGGDE